MDVYPGDLFIVFEVEFPSSVPADLHPKFRELLPAPENQPMVCWVHWVGRLTGHNAVNGQ